MKSLEEVVVGWCTKVWTKTQAWLWQSRFLLTYCNILLSQPVQSVNFGLFSTNTTDAGHRFVLERKRNCVTGRDRDAAVVPTES